MCNNESKKYDENKLCEERIIEYFSKTTTTTSINYPVNTNRTSFMDIVTHLTTEHFGRHKHKGLSKYKPSAPQLKSFIHVRQVVDKFKGKAPVYKSFKGVKKEELIDMCFDLRHRPIETRQFVDPDK